LSADVWRLEICAALRYPIIARTDRTDGSSLSVPVSGGNTNVVFPKVHIILIMRIMPFEPPRALSVDKSQGSDRKREENLVKKRYFALFAFSYYSFRLKNCFRSQKEKNVCVSCHRP
jgi:hypothetical protein